MTAKILIMITWTLSQAKSQTSRADWRWVPLNGEKDPNLHDRPANPDGDQPNAHPFKPNLRISIRGQRWAPSNRQKTSQTCEHPKNPRRNQKESQREK